MQRTITTAATVAKNILPEKWFAWLRNRGEAVFGPTFVYMIREDLEGLPAAELPESYRATSVTPGREMDYVQVIQESLAESADEAWYCEAFKDDPDYDPRNLLIVRDGDVPVAVAAAWQIEWEGRKIGLIHNVGVATDYLGKGLGRIVTILALHRLRERGFQRVLLSSEDHRIPALSLYLSLGFEPVYFSWLHGRRWKKILQNTRSRTAVGKPAEVSGTYASRGTPPE